MQILHDNLQAWFLGRPCPIYDRQPDTEVLSGKKGMELKPAPEGVRVTVPMHQKTVKRMQRIIELLAEAADKDRHALVVTNEQGIGLMTYADAYDDIRAGKAFCRRDKKKQETGK